MLFDFHKPLLNVCESLFAGDIVAEEDAVGASVENSSDWAEGLLSCSVPNLQLHDFVINLHDKAAELHTNCYLVLQLEVIVHYASQQAWFSNTYTTPT